MRELNEGDVVVVCPRGEPPLRGTVVRHEDGSKLVRDENGLYHHYFPFTAAGGRMTSRGGTIYDSPEQYAAFTHLRQLQDDMRDAARVCNDPTKLEAALAVLKRKP